jgi:hypothetical protein
MTLTQLLTYCKRQASIDPSNYDSASSYNADKYERNKQRLKLIKRYGFINELPVGQSSNGRFIVTNDLIEYTAGQYAAAEIYSAAYDYLVNNLK